MLVLSVFHVNALLEYSAIKH